MKAIRIMKIATIIMLLVIGNIFMFADAEDNIYPWN
jgi:hypothetical protein